MGKIGFRFGNSYGGVGSDVMVKNEGIQDIRREFIVSSISPTMEMELGKTIGRPCYFGCREHNPHFAKLCNELRRYRLECTTNKRFGGFE